MPCHSRLALSRYGHWARRTSRRRYPKQKCTPRRASRSAFGHLWRTVGHETGPTATFALTGLSSAVPRKSPGRRFARTKVTSPFLGINQEGNALFNLYIIVTIVYIQNSHFINMVVCGNPVIVLVTSSSKITITIIIIVGTAAAKKLAKSNFVEETQLANCHMQPEHALSVRAEYYHCAYCHTRRYSRIGPAQVLGPLAFRYDELTEELSIFAFNNCCYCLPDAAARPHMSSMPEYAPFFSSLGLLWCKRVWW